MGRKPWPERSDRGTRARRSEDAGETKARLLGTARDMLRRKPPVHLPRSDLARAAGVAPALITYYFKDEDALVEEVAKPVIDAHLARLRDVLSEPRDKATTLRALVILLLEISREDGQLLESYLNFAKQPNRVDPSGSFFARAYGMMDAFFRDAVDDGTPGRATSAFVQTALWGMCKTIAQTPALADFLREPGDTRPLADVEADHILRLVEGLLLPQAMLATRGAGPA